MPDKTRWWQSFQKDCLMRSKLDEFLRDQPPFDIIDCPPMFVSKRIHDSTIVVARSVQPDISYILSDIRNIRSIRQLVILPSSYLFALLKILLVFLGWKRANFILCLGSLELKSMKAWCPWWRSKLISYKNALAKYQQTELMQVRLSRNKNEKEGTRFLWIGRWVAHKGVKELVSFIMKSTASNSRDTFTIAGCGSLAERDFPWELIQNGTVRILPSFGRSELSSLLAEHDVGLFTSRVEGWGLVLNEMLESGMYVSATQAGGVPDLQPFFKHTLQSFPPAIQTFSQETIKPEPMETYYDIFSWKKIAEEYIKSLTSYLQ
ncbi:MAG: glycosyltransferase [Cyanobacteria bacterium J06560_6]